VGWVHSAPPGLCGLDELDGHRDSGGAGAGSLRDPLSEPDGGEGAIRACSQGFVLTSRQELRGLPGNAGMWDYSFKGPILWVTGSAAAAAIGRSFRSGLWACAWATVLGVPLIIAAWLAEALHWYQHPDNQRLELVGALTGASVLISTCAMKLEVTLHYSAGRMRGRDAHYVGC
jgi:hypothetical protein